MHCDILRKGTGVPLIFLHGFLGTGQDWRAVVEHLIHRTCLAYDLPGHGKTPWTDDEIEDLLAKALPSEPINLVGYSLGGRIALRFALRHPLRIHSLTLLSTNYGLSNSEEKEKRIKTDQAWAHKILSLPWDKFLAQWYAQPIFSSLQQKPAIMRKILSTRTLQKPQGLVNALLKWSLGHQKCYRNELQQFSRPTKILYGEKDEKFIGFYGDWPQAYCIAKAGHNLLFESPQMVADLLL